MILRRRGHGRRGKIIVSPQSTAKQYTPLSQISQLNLTHNLVLIIQNMNGMVLLLKTL